MVKTDPTIERIRQVRHEISEQCNHDSRKLVEYYIRYQQRYKDRLLEKPVLVKRSTLAKQGNEQDAS